MDHSKYIGNSYRILREIGRGGNGIIYLVRQVSTDQLRAAKCMKSGKNAKSCQEIQLMKRLHHKSLPDILDVIEIDGEIWLIMEYIHGKCLNEIPLEERTEKLFFSVARQLAEVLVYLHTRTPPIYHLDLKPTNVLLKPNGGVVLIDFGAALLKDRNANSSGMGTPGFAAPEQFSKNVFLDERADIYGFAATLFYFLYGRTYRFGKERKKWKEYKNGEHWKRPMETALLTGLAQNREERPDTLPELFLKMRRAELYVRFQGQIKKIFLSCILLAAVILFTVNSYSDIYQNTEAQEHQEEPTVSELIERAQLQSIDQAFDLYAQAAQQDPYDASWCLNLMERFVEDGSFGLEEEAELNELLYEQPVLKDSRTLLDYWRENSSLFSEVAYKIGEIYWYYFTGSGGKYAAAGWFHTAAEADRDNILAVLHEKIAQAYSEKEQSTGQDEGGALLGYWATLYELYASDDWKQKMGKTQGFLWEEILSMIIFHSSELLNSEESGDTLRGIIEEIEQELRRGQYFGKEDKENLLNNCKAAREALIRCEEAERCSGITAVN